MASTSEATRRRGGSPQQREALDLANVVRSGHAEVKQLVATGELTVADALYDARARRLRVGHLICAQRLWGPTRANKLLRPMYISPTRRVDELTERQRRALIEALNSTTP